MSVQIPVNVDSPMSFLCMQTASLLDENGYQAYDGDDDHCNEASQFSQDNGEDDESDEGKSDCTCSEGQESSSYAHKLKRLL